MPELPEVETIRRSLDKVVLGQKILDVEIRDNKLFRGKKEATIGKTIQEIARRSKMLIWKLSGGSYLLFHLKMTGQLLYDSTDHKQIAGGGHPDREYLKPPPHKHTHVIFRLEKGHLYFNDLRKFGWIKVLSENELKKEVKGLGPEISWPEFTFEYFRERLSKKAQTKIKTALLDQTVLAGIGNIYSDETLFCAKVLPTRLVKDLSERELKRIYSCLPEIISLALSHGGTSLKDYRQLDGSTGNFLEHAKVYHRTGKPCRICQTPIARQIINGRSAHYCPKCQG